MLPVSVAELEEAAREAMDPKAAAYVFAGAGTEDTMRANREAFRAPADRAADAARRRRARPLDHRAAARRCRRRCCWRRSASQKIVHPDGELATRPRGGGARRADGRQHRVRLHAGGDRRGQRRRAALVPALLARNDAELAESFVERAEAAGYSAIVLTVDTFMLGWKPRDLQQAWLALPATGSGIANYLQDPVFRSQLEKSPEEDLGAAIGHFLSVLRQPRAHLGRPRPAARS